MVVIVVPARFLNVYDLLSFLLAELFTSNISIPAAPVSVAMVVVVVYHSIAVQSGIVGLHSTEAYTLLPSQAVAVIVTLPSAKNVTFPVY